MNKRNNIARLVCISVCLLSIVFAGCGGSDSTSSNSELTVLPDYLDFGIVTNGNSVEPLSLTIRNDGTSNLKVTDIALSDTVN